MSVKGYGQNCYLHAIQGSYGNTCFLSGTINKCLDVIKTNHLFDV